MRDPGKEIAIYNLQVKLLIQKKNCLEGTKDNDSLMHAQNGYVRMQIVTLKTTTQETF